MLCISDKGRGAVVYIIKRAVQSLKWVCQQFPRLFIYTTFNRELLNVKIPDIMKDFFLITKLQRQICTYMEGNRNPIHTADFFWALRPYMALHRIELRDHGITLHSFSSNKKRSDVIDSDQVLGISICRNGMLMLFLSNGDICILSRHSSACKRVRIYRQKFLHIILIEIQLCFWRLKEQFLY